MTLFILPLFLGPTELILILLVVLLLFGGRKIPELMRGLGRGVKEFKDSSNASSSTSEKLRQAAPPRRADRQAAGIRHPAPREQTGKRDRIRATKAMYATRKTYRTA